MEGWRLRGYEPERDLGSVEDLWQAALAPTWPVLSRELAGLRRGIVAEVGGRIVGFIAIQRTLAPGRRGGSLPLLIVHPDQQRAGLGSALLAEALTRLRGFGVTQVQVGRGGPAYIWPGVPLDLPAAVAFFARHGFTASEDCVDLTCDLRDYRPPTGAYERPDAAGITLGLAGPDELAAAAAFEAATYPQWMDRFDGTGGDIVLARDRDGAIVGSLLCSADGPGRYAPLLGPRAGFIACVGVRPDRDGQGIGTALVARASELLRDAGTRTCLIDWVVREAFYTRLGYRPWRRYRMFGQGLATT